jgi:hypothetical protein
MAARAEATVGAHRLVFEAEDIIICHFGPTLTEKEMLAIIELQVAHVRGKPYFLLIDLTRIGSIPAPVRRTIGMSAKVVKLRGIAIYGGSFHMKALAKLINTALSIFGKNPFPQEFFEGEEAAMAWLRELRKQQPAVGA